MNNPKERIATLSVRMTNSKTVSYLLDAGLDYVHDIISHGVQNEIAD